MTNPNKSIGTNGAYSGRTSVNAFNDVLQCFTGRGVLTGFGIRPGTGMTVSVGGTAGVRDVAIAEDNNGNFTTVNNISAAPVTVSIPAAPTTNSRIDAIVAYVSNPPQGSATAVDNPGACGLIPVSGATAASPTTPTESNIRAAISADGGSGSTAYYVVLGYVQVATGTTDITVDMLSAAPHTQLNYVGDGQLTLNASGTGAGNNIYFSANQTNDTTQTPVWGTSNIGNSAITYAKMANDAIHTAEIQDGAVTASKLANLAVTDAKIDWSTINSGHNWKFLTRKYLISGHTEDWTVNLPHYDCYKLVLNCEFESGGTWIDIRPIRGTDVITCNWARSGYIGDAVQSGKGTGPTLMPIACQDNQGVSAICYSFWSKGSGNRSWVGMWGSGTSAGVGGSHFTTGDATVDAFVVRPEKPIRTSGGFLEVWGRDPSTS